MTYKKIVIEDNKGRKYYPVTSVKNIPDIENISEYINIDNIKIDSSTSEKLGDTIINIKNDLKDHKHSANDITETNSRKFVTNAQLLDINTISDKATKTYVNNKVKEVNQFDSINKGNYSFHSLKEPGIYRLYNSSTSPCGTSADYIMAVYKYNNNVIQVAHSSTSRSNAHSNKVYVRSYYSNTWSDWRELTNVDVEKEIDNLKQSGVESNRILVDALNSKGVSASTSSTIKTNVNKVKDIKVGDYSVGDTIYFENLKPLEWDYKPFIIWDYTGYLGDITALVVGNDDYIYTSSNDETVTKLTSEGDRVWKFYGHNDYVNGVAVDSEGYVYSGSDDKKVMKISPGGSKVWEFTGHSGIVYDVAVDEDGYIYSASHDCKVMKISPQGNKVWELANHRYPAVVEVGDDGYVYSGDDNTLRKISPQGDIIWGYKTGGYTDSVKSIVVNKDGYVYCGFYTILVKVSPQGRREWGIKGGAYSLALDSNDYLYIGKHKTTTAMSPSGDEIWNFKGHDSYIFGIGVDSDDYVYVGGRDEKVMKISPGIPISYKIIA